MRAAILEQIGDDRLVVANDLVLGPVAHGEVRVAIRATGVCHTDLHAMDGTLPSLLPAVLGHEGAGVVLEVGNTVHNVEVGDHVVLAWSPPCGRCTFCVRHRQPHLCHEVQLGAALHAHWHRGSTPVFGFSGLGTFAEEVIVPATAAVPIPKDVPFPIASLLGCGVTTGVGAAINTAKVQPGDTCIVFGCGGVGMSVIQGCRIAGAATIVAVDLLAPKRDAAMRLGATHAVAPDEVASVKGDLTGPSRGFDHGFEAIGLPTTIRAAYDATRRGGAVTIVGAGHTSHEVTFNAFELFFEEKHIQGSYYGSADVRFEFGRLIELWRSGRLDLEGLITAEASLDGVHDAVAALRAGEGIRTVLTFS